MSQTALDDWITGRHLDPFSMCCLLCNLLPSGTILQSFPPSFDVLAGRNLILEPNSREESKPGDMEEVNQCCMLLSIYQSENGCDNISTQFTCLASDKVLACENFLRVIKTFFEIFLEGGNRGSIWLAMTHHPTKVSLETHRVQNESAYLLNNFS